MKRIMIVLPVLLIVVLMFGVSGCGKTTGGGWFYNYGDTSQKITFGFNAQPTDYGAKGQFELIDSLNKLNLHGTFNEIPHGTPPRNIPVGSIFSGTCTVNGQGPYPFCAGFSDVDPEEIGPGDAVSVYVEYGDQDLEYEGVLGGGNIMVHASSW